MRAPLTAVPSSPKRRAKERPESDRALLGFVVALFREFAAGRPLFGRRAELRAEAHRKVDAYFDAKLAGR